MKTILAVILMLAASVYAPAQTSNNNKKTSTAPAAQGNTIPKDAVPNADGTSYLYTDKQGKKWVYAKTPFGIIKNAYSDPGAAASTGPDSMTKAIDKGDTVRFERPGPFGVMSWEKKKADLTDDERHMLDASSAKKQ